MEVGNMTFQSQPETEEMQKMCDGLQFGRKSAIFDHEHDLI